MVKIGKLRSEQRKRISPPAGTMIPSRKPDQIARHTQTGGVTALFKQALTKVLRFNGQQLPAVHAGNAMTDKHAAYCRDAWSVFAKVTQCRFSTDGGLKSRESANLPRQPKQLW